MRLVALLRNLAVVGMSTLAAGKAAPAEPFRIGLVMPMTGQFSAIARQMEAGARLFISQNGDSVAGRRVELIVKDDGGNPEVSRRISQELVVRDKVDVLAGYGLTPLAMAAAPVATQAKTPMLVLNAATSSVTEASPFIVRTSMTLPQVTLGIAEWAPKNKIKKVVTLVTDYAPGIDAERTFKERFVARGGEIVGSVRVPLHGPDFAPFLQRVTDAAPDAVFVFVPAPTAPVLMKQFSERGLDKSGIRLIGPGDMVDDDSLNAMGDVALGVVTSHHYSAAHDSEANRAFVAAFRKANNGMRPNFIAVGAYDGMRILYAAIKATNGVKSGEALLEQMKGQSFESPRGLLSVDSQTRDVVQDVYIRKVERVNGELYNVEFDALKQVKDPVKAAKAVAR